MLAILTYFYTSMYVAVAALREFGLPYEDSVRKSVLTDSALKSDPIHPNARGYARIAEALASLLKQDGAI